MNWREVFTFTGAFLAYLIGSGFASGQEVMQFFTSHGVKGAFGATALTLIIFAWFSITFMKAGYQLKDKLNSSNDIFKYYCGRWLGKFFEICIPFFYSVPI